MQVGPKNVEIVQVLSFHQYVCNAQYNVCNGQYMFAMLSSVGLLQI